MASHWLKFIGGATVIVRVLVSWLLALAALVVTVKVPLSVGVPLISPVVALTVKPAGNPVAPKLVGLFVPVI